MPKPPHRITWEGLLEVPATDDYRFHALLGKDESVQIEVNKWTVFDSTHKINQQTIRLTAGSRVPVRISYTNRKGRCELKVLWTSRLLDRQPIDTALLYLSR